MDDLQVERVYLQAYDGDACGGTIFSLKYRELGEVVLMTHLHELDHAGIKDGRFRPYRKLRTERLIFFPERLNSLVWCVDAEHADIFCLETDS